MLGIKNFDYNKHKAILENSFRLAQDGKILPGDSRGHSDGWGIGYYEKGKALVHKSGGSVLSEKKDFFRTLQKIARSPVLIVHLRKSAWPDTSTADSAHPFKYKNFLFAHNGTIYDYKKLLKDIASPLRPRSNALDTEVYFRYLLNSMCLKYAVRQIQKNNKYSSLTSLFSDGTNLYAYREYRKSPDYYTLYSAQFGDAYLVSSEPVSPHLKWKILNERKLLVV